MKTTVFSRILGATLLPLIIVFSLVILTINEISYDNASVSPRKAPRLSPN